MIKKRTRLTEAEKKEIRGNITYLLEHSLELYGKEDPKRAVDEGYGIIRGYYNALLLAYTTEAIDEGMYEEIWGIWEVFRLRVRKEYKI